MSQLVHFTKVWRWPSYCAITDHWERYTYTTQIAKFMRPTWGPPESCQPQMGPMLAQWTLLSGSHQVVSLIANRHNIWTFELHVYSGLNTNLWHVVADITHLKWCRKIFPCEIIFHLGLLRFNSGDQPIEWHKSLLAVFGKCSMLIFVKTRYETTIFSVICRHLKFHYKNRIRSYTHDKIWHVSIDLQPWNITMLESDTSPDVNTAETQCRRRDTIASQAKR